ncbi:hypothetical protein [Tsukamurella hominis]|uniref:hypothetical protein n=1 Tax=Tsukamurella hominis TaxID=1970232 RepID=UPI0039EB5B7A
MAGALFGAGVSWVVAQQQIDADDGRSNREYVRQHRVDSYSEFMTTVSDALKSTTWISTEFTENNWRRNPNNPQPKPPPPESVKAITEARDRVSAKYAIVAIYDSDDSDRLKLAYRLYAYFVDLANTTELWSSQYDKSPDKFGLYTESIARLSGRYSFVGSCNVGAIAQCISPEERADPPDINSALNATHDAYLKSPPEVVNELARAVREEALRE